MSLNVETNDLKLICSDQLSLSWSRYRRRAGNGNLPWILASDNPLFFKLGNGNSSFGMLLTMVVLKVLTIL